jgi:hypothetical protein
LWRDQVIAAGEREAEAVYQALVTRQREWETAPHPGHAGRSPVELIVEERRAQRKPPPKRRKLR